MGYIQTKIREINEKVDDQQNEITKLSITTESLKRQIEEKSNEIDELYDRIKEKPDNVHKHSSSSDIRKQVAQAMNGYSDKLLKRFERRLSDAVEKAQVRGKNQGEETLELITNEIIKHQILSTHSLGEILIDFYNELLQAGVIKKLFLPSIILYENPFGRDCACIIDFEKGDVQIQHGKNLVRKTARQCRIVSNNARERNPIKKI